MMETTTMNEIIFGSENLRTKSLRILKNFEYRSNP
jgi:hypothetical protein